MNPTKKWLSLLIFLFLLSSQVFAQAEFTDSEIQMVRSVLERQITLLELNSLAEKRLNDEALQTLIKASTETFSNHHEELLALSRKIGMLGVEGLPPPPYFSRVIARWENLTDGALVRDYLLIALQCQSFIERSISSQLRQEVNTELQQWLQARVEEVNSRMRDVDHLLYELP